MNTKAITYMCVIVAATFFACQKDVQPTIAPSKKPQLNDSDVLIDTKTTYQQIESFMASDAWMPNIVGTYWDENTKSAIAELLFSKEVANGTPKGIGLSGWRFLLGGGSFNQGSNSGIALVDRRSESFMDPQTGAIDWTKQKGQLYFLDKAKTYGVDQFVMFSNSPPIPMTKNGRAYSSSGASSNLRDDQYDDFADYMTSVATHLRDAHGLNINYISPINEPQYNWDGAGQEGSGWQNTESFKLIEELDRSIRAKNLTTKILFGESAAYNYLYEDADKAGRANVLNNFFREGSSLNIGKFPSVAKVVAAHSYWLDGNWNVLNSTRERVQQQVSQAGLKLYQTEWSMLGDQFSPNEFIGFEQASYMDIALYLSKVIHTDLAVANAASWSFWTSMDLERWSHKNRFYLIRLRPTAGDYGDVLAGGTYEATKTLWVLGNYSLFIRPGYTRVKMELNGQGESYFGSGYLSPDQKTFVAVYTNKSSEAKQIQVDPGLGTPKSIMSYTTSETANLREQSVANLQTAISLAGKSVVTVKYVY